MLLFILAYLGGVLTILSPCILPVLPFVFARSDQPFARSGLPLLAGMSLTFAAVATLAAVGGGWVAQANTFGRGLAIVLLGVFGLTLLLPRFGERLMHPLVRAGGRLSALAGDPRGAPGHDRSTRTGSASFVLGIATGLLWAPCAGPILGLVLTGAALNGASASTTLLLLSYAAGAATSLAVALLIGGRVFAAMKRSLGAGEWIRRGIGAAMLTGVGAIALGLDTGVLANLSTVATGGIEQHLVDRLARRPVDRGAMRTGTAHAGGADVMEGAAAAMAMRVSAPQLSLPVEGQLPELTGAVQWLNSPPLTAQGLRGKVVLIDFWTYSCINCLHALPYVKAWSQKYRDKGLVVIGVHSPEFAFERNVDNVRRAMKDLGLDFPVAIDNDFRIWRAFNNEYWPAHYFVDAQGRIRYHHFGEGKYAESEAVIRQLLIEAGRTDVATVALEPTPAATGIDGTRDDGAQPPLALNP